MSKKEEIYNILKENNIKYEAVEHTPVYTMEEMLDLELDKKGRIIKNIFLFCRKTKRHFLVIMEEAKRLNLKDLSTKLESKLTFASEEDLEKYLNLSKGAVSPFGLLYDKEKAVIFVIDKDLTVPETNNIIGIHPCDNTATVFLEYSDLIKLVKNTNNNDIEIIEI
ncbi:prolyl-tRNA synthetase associated domain-containing protein [Brachyspira alvinipulli]|uniref:prolyl-tRNA synthetase associated domain-containing protein n=1 Tax=Brachyspira alvinipulli TaxID=84379 RepID=UPI0004B0E1CF|nr:prolyl-tRNA synthetase associated domain-containing protein [Brachyspira alvinipulli]